MPSLAYLRQLGSGHLAVIQGQSRADTLRKFLLSCIYGLSQLDGVSERPLFSPPGPVPCFSLTCTERSEAQELQKLPWQMGSKPGGGGQASPFPPQDFP